MPAWCRLGPGLFFPDASLSDTDRKALLARARQAIETQVYPAYAKLIAYEEALERKARPICDNSSGLSNIASMNTRS